MTSTTHTTPPTVGTTGTVLLGKYRVDHVLGSGGMGMVVAATHLQLQERVAIKFLLPEAAAHPDVVTRFMREGQAAARLKGEHAARVIDVGILPDGTPYLVMEHLAGQDLAALVASQQRLAPTETVDYILQACEALAEAHALGLIHRDVKPGNLFITRRPDGSPLLKILDFGISKLPLTFETALTQAQSMMGTPSYMSPEQMRSARDVDARTDIWALGVVIYECLSGRRPFDAESFSALVVRVTAEPPTPLPASIASGLADVVYRCLEKHPDNRFRTIADLAGALAPFAGNKRAAATIVERTRAICDGVSAVVTEAIVDSRAKHTTLGSSVGELTPQPARSRRVLIIATALLSAAVAIAAIIFTTRGPDEATSMRPPDAAARPTAHSDPVDAAIDAAPTDAAEAPDAIIGSPHEPPVGKPPKSPIGKAPKRPKAVEPPVTSRVPMDAGPASTTDAPPTPPTRPKCDPQKDPKCLFDTSH